MSDHSPFFIQYKIGPWKVAAIEEWFQIINIMLLSLQNIKQTQESSNLLIIILVGKKTQENGYYLVVEIIYFDIYVR